MPYKPIPDDEVQPEQERTLAPARERLATEDLLQRFPEVKVYGLLLTADPKHAISQVVRERWSELHRLTGSKIMLLVFEKPNQWPEGLKNYWKLRLGNAFDKTWQEWQQGPEAGLAFDYLDLFEQPKLKPEQLPCLVLFTQPQAQTAVVRSIPTWDADSLYPFLMGLIETVGDCADQSLETRLECLRNSLTSPSAIFASQLGHVGNQALDYMKRYPAQVVTTTLSFVLALTTGSILPLSPLVVSVLQATKDALSGAKSS